MRAADALEKASREKQALLHAYKTELLGLLADSVLADLALTDPALWPMVTELIRVLSRTGTPAMRARGRKILLQLEQ